MVERIPKIDWEKDRGLDRDFIKLRKDKEPLFFGDNLDRLATEEEIFNKKFIKFENINKFRNLIDKEVDWKHEIGWDREVRPGDILGIRQDIVKDMRDFARDLKGREVELPSPTVGGLAGLLERFPQIGEKGGIRYLLTSGLAVEAITGFTRRHHDTDLVICDTSSNWWMKLLTDNVTHRKYWADMSFEEGFLESTAWKATFTAGGKEYTILTVHPAVLIIQKLSNAWGRPPRVKDLMDVKALIGFWKKLGFDKKWLLIIGKALDALPNERERERTVSRLEEALDEAKSTTFSAESVV